MSLSKKLVLTTLAKVRLRRVHRQLACVGLGVVMAACTANNTKLGTEGYVKGFFGGVAGDEPRAVLEARKILSSGGNAVDAATTMYFTLAVTMPSAASLGGGGTCLVYRPALTRELPQKIEALQFLTGLPSRIPAAATRPSGVPGNAIGMFALHARYGTMPWGEIVSVGENLARFGTQVSRALLTHLKSVENALLQDTESRRIFRGAGGGPIKEGDFIRQPDLANAMSNLRVNGPVDFHRGKFAALFVERVLAAGGSLSLDDMRRYKPRWTKTISMPFGSFFRRNTAHFVPPPAAAGLVQAQMLQMLNTDGIFASVNEVEQYHVLAEVGLTAFAERARWMRQDFTSKFPPKSLLDRSVTDTAMKNYSRDQHLSPKSFRPVPRPTPESPSATSFVVVDRFGMAVTCAFTMNNAFGTGRIAKDTGIMIAAIPRGAGKGPISLGPMMIINEKSDQFLLAAAGAGGVTVPTAVASVVARTYLDGQSLDAAMRAPRVHHSGVPDVTYHEPTLPQDIIVALRKRGHRVTATPQIGLINVAHCLGGLPRDPATCSLMNDPRGNGLTVNALTELEE